MSLPPSLRVLLGGVLALAVIGCTASVDDSVSNTPGAGDVLDLWVRTHRDHVEEISSALGSSPTTETRGFRPVPVWTVESADLSTACADVGRRLATSKWKLVACGSEPDPAGLPVATLATTATGRYITERYDFSISMQIRLWQRDGTVVASLAVDEFHQTD